MNTKNVLLVVAGVAVGYLLAGYLKTKSTSEPTVDQAKLADCTKKVEEEIAVTMFKTSANFDMNVYKKEAIDRCLKGGAM
jgi:hypothetical protein